jgi:alkylated DNA repair dioxygenase AlkB
MAADPKPRQPDIKHADLGRSARPEQLGLFAPARDTTLDTVVPGLTYCPAFLSTDDEENLLDDVRRLPFRHFAFHGYLGNRRTVSYGWKYDFAQEKVLKADDMPDFLRALRVRAAALAGVTAALLEQVLVTEYAPGAGIGWHKDKNVFADVVGISLLSACRFRLRRKRGETWQRASFIAAPRSAYVLRGAARTEWEHSIPALDSLRYSVTFRSLT